MKMETAPSALTVSDVNRYLKMLVTSDEVLSSVAVRGEIFNFKPHPSGHLYFTLKDQAAEISAVMFRGDASRLNFRPSNGMKVLIYGTVDVYEKGGRYQLYARTMLEDGVGSLYPELERLKKKLEAEGLFAESAKRPLPPYPHCVGVVTAPSGAAIRDILNITGRRDPSVDVLIFPSLVQGEGAAASLCAGIEFLNAEGSCDVIIIGRGGGSAEDLWAFNNEQLVRAVAASEIPVISAVGHETDFTLCDFAADRRAPTPSAAAELAVPDRHAIVSYLTEKQKRLDTRFAQLFARKQQMTERYQKTLSLLSPANILLRKQERLQHQKELLQREMNHCLDNERKRFALALSRLNSLNPLALLERGYSVLQREDGYVVSRTSELTAGEKVTAVMSDGSVEALVLSVTTKKNEEDIGHGESKEPRQA